MTSHILSDIRISGTTHPLPAICDQPREPAAPTQPLSLPALTHKAGAAADQQKKDPPGELPAAQTTKSEDPLALIASLHTKRAEAKALAAAAAKAAKATSEEVEPKKRPASKPASNCKSSSSSCKSVLKANTKAMKKAAAATASLSTAKRLRVRPKGCSKCRWTPGCAPSCLRGALKSLL